MIRHVFTDANVLFSAPLRSVLINLALIKAIRMSWSEAVNREWVDALMERRPDLKRGNLQLTVAAMNEALPDANVVEYENLIDRFKLPDPDDRHVAAAALRAGCPIILTYNLKDFPAEAVNPHQLSTAHPDAFLADVAVGDLDALVTSARYARADLRRPPVSATDYRRIGLDRTARLLEPHIGAI